MVRQLAMLTNWTILLTCACERGARLNSSSSACSTLSFFSWGRLEKVDDGIFLLSLFWQCKLACICGALAAVLQLRWAAVHVHGGGKVIAFPESDTVSLSNWIDCTSHVTRCQNRGKLCSSEGLEVSMNENTLVIKEHSFSIEQRRAANKRYR